MFSIKILPAFPIILSSTIYPFNYILYDYFTESQYSLNNRKAMPSLTQLFLTTKSIKSIGNHSYDLLKLYHVSLNIATNFYTATFRYSPLSVFSYTHSASLPKKNNSSIIVRSQTRILPSIS